MRFEALVGRPRSNLVSAAATGRTPNPIDQQNISLVA